MGKEVRITNAVTGGEKGRKPERYSLIPWPEMDEVGRLYAAGAEKYTDGNWAKGYDWSLSFDALMRHATAWWSGEQDDPELGTDHMASVIFHALALMRFRREHPELDDRPHTWTRAQ